MSVTGPAGYHGTWLVRLSARTVLTCGSVPASDGAIVVREKAMAKMMSSFAEEMFLIFSKKGSPGFSLKRLSSLRNLSAIHGKIGILQESQDFPGLYNGTNAKERYWELLQKRGNGVRIREAPREARGV